MENNQNIRTRFAPSPTGYMHIGNLRTALYAYLFARNKNGTFVLRIEDTDQKRYVEGAVDVIMQTLKETGLNHDEGPDKGGNVGPYYQSERKPLYEEYALKLVESGDAYYCFCQKDEEEKEDEEGTEKVFGHHCDCKNIPLETAREMAKTKPYVIRQRIKEGTTTFHDEVYGDITVDNSTLDDQVLLKSDKMPTYNFANVIDDHLMQISHVMRGKEYISSTPKYELLYRALGWQSPKVVHLSTIMGRNSDGSVSKLSKRHGSVSFAKMLEEGYMTEAVINYIALLGWSPKSEREKFTLEELCEAFNLEGIVKTNAIFDYGKLDWMNSLYIKELSENEFAKRGEKFLETAPKCVKEKWDVASKLAHGRINKFSDIPNLFAFLENYGDFDLALFENKKNKTTQESCLATLKDLLPEFENVKDFTIENLNQIAENYAAKNEMKLGAVMWPARIAVSGTMVTPGGMGEMMYLLGKDETISRLKTSIKRLENNN